MLPTARQEMLPSLITLPLLNALAEQMSFQSHFLINISHGQLVSVSSTVKVMWWLLRRGGGWKRGKRTDE